MAENFHDYWVSRTPEQKRELAEFCGHSNETFLSQIAHGHVMAGLRTITKLQSFDSRFTAEFMRPDLVAPKRVRG